ncbi:MAG: hypothetical protein ACJ76V_06905 [Thermoleophilaceae bacterium]
MIEYERDPDELDEPAEDSDEDEHEDDDFVEELESDPAYSPPDGEHLRDLKGG